MSHYVSPLITRRAVLVSVVAVALFAAGLQLSISPSAVLAQSAGVTVSSTAVTVAGEGQSNSYTVVLDAAPTQEVTVTPSSNNTDVTFTPSHLTFTTSNWSTAQTITVRGLHDDDLDNDSATISHAVAGYGTVTSASDVTVTVTDDDTPSISVFPTNMLLTRGNGQVVTISLSHQPKSNVTISLSTGTILATVSPTSLTFSSSDWSPKTATITSQTTAGSSNARTLTTAAAQGTGSGYAGINPADVSWEGLGDDVSVIRVSKLGVRPQEGGTDTFDVTLSTDPGGTRTVAISQTGSSVTLDKTSLTFNSGNYNTTQTVTVTGASDNDAVDDTGSLSLSATGYRSSPVRLYVDDDDTPGLTIAPATNTLSITEGQMGTYTVQLASEPTGDVTVSINDPAGTDITSSPDTLTFSKTGANAWNSPKTVTVSVASDSDTADDIAAITHTTSGGGYGQVNAPDMVITATEGGEPGFSFSPSSVDVDEEDTATYDMELAARPSASVTVTISSNNSDVTVDTDTGTNGNQNTLTFTTSNWDTGQTVTVSGGADDDAVDDSATLSHSASGGGYGSVTGNVSVTVDDNDSAGVTVSSSQVSLGEGGSTTYGLTLKTQPSSNVTITPSSTNSEVTLNPASRTFTPSNWSTQQNFTVAASQDDDADNDSATISHSVAQTGGSMEYNAITIGSVSVTVTDDDTAGVTISPSGPFDIDEGDSQSYTVVLDTRPSANVTITPTLPTGSPPLTITAGSSLTFTSSNWNTTQTVTIRSDQDDDAADGAYTITHSVSGYGTVTAGSVTINVDDDDSQGVTLSESSKEIDEGSTDTYTLVLDTKPVGGNVTITPTSADTTRVTVSPSSVTFTASNWNTAKTITAAARQDGDAADNSVKISHTISGGDYGSVSVGDFTVNVDEDDTASVVLSKTTLEVDESSTATYTVRLSHTPTSAVTVTINDPTDNDDAVISASPASLEFTATNFSTAKTVTVTAGADDDARDGSGTITHTVAQTGGSMEYNGVTVSNVDVDEDDDTANVIVSETALTVNEASTGTYTLKLATDPSHNVTVTINDPSSSTGISANPASVTFTGGSSGNWNTTQTVTVSAANDDNTIRETASITHSVSSTDTQYNNISTGSVAITANDDDTASVTVSKSAVTPAEGASETYTVKLNTQPASNVTITVSPGSNSDVTIDTDTGTTGNQNTLTFTNSTWSTAQTVTVSAAEDDDAATDTATITHSASGADYGSVTIGSVGVTVTENDSVGATISPTTLEITENDDGTASATYSIVLTSEPVGGNAIVDLSKGGDAAGDISLSVNSITFTSSNWDTAVTVTVTVANDFDATDEAATISHVTRSNSSDYSSKLFNDVTVNIDDNDIRGVTINPTSLNVDEEGTNTYTVVLDTQPTGDVTVAITDAPIPNPLDPSLIIGGVSVVGSDSLTFSASTWNTAQTVTLRAHHDTDGGDDVHQITHTVSGADYTTTPAITVSNVAATSVDNDTRGFAIIDENTLKLTELELEIAEGTSQTYRLLMETRPEPDNSNVVVTPSFSSGAPSSLTIAPTSVSRNHANWGAVITFTVTSAQDNDVQGWTGEITHTVTGADYGANNVTAPDIDIDLSDDDAPRIDVSAPATGFTIDEGEGASYTMVLGFRPSSNVTVTVNSGSNPDITVNPSQLTFTTSDWNTAQTIQISTAHDNTDTADESTTITHTPSGGGYGNVSIQDVPVTVIDDDEPEFSVGTQSIQLAEGGSDTYSLSLAVQPYADVTVNVGVQGSGDVRVSPTQLTFSSTTWNTAQIVTVTAQGDADANRDEATITHTGSGAQFTDPVTGANFAGPTIEVLVVEDGEDVPNDSSFLQSSSCDSSLLLTWNAPVGEGEEIASFRLQWRTASQSFSETQRTINVDASAVSHTLSSLQNDVEYAIRIIGLDSTGQPLWSKETQGTPEAGACISNVRFGNILADSTPVIVEVAQAVVEQATVEPILVNMQYRSLNPGVWSDTFTQLLEPGETSVSFDIRGLRPDSKYEVRTWTGPSQTPPVDESGEAAPAAQVVFTSGSLPGGTRFTPGGGGGSIARVLRIEPSIRAVTLSGGDSVVLSVEVYGRQNVHDNSLLDKDPSQNRPALVWNSDGGEFGEADIRSEWRNRLADDREVIFTAPDTPGRFLVTVGFADDFNCLSAQDEESVDDYEARCTAKFTITVRRPSTAPEERPAPENPIGEIPQVLVDAEGRQYEVLTPEDGGTFQGGHVTLSAGAGVVPNLEIVGVRVDVAGPASNIGQSHHRYSLAGMWHEIRAIDADEAAVSGYVLESPLEVCLPLPDVFRSNISDVAVVSAKSDGSLTVLSSSVRITMSGTSVCGGLSELPASVAVGRLGSPADLPTPTPSVDETELPDTGGHETPLFLAVLAVLLGSAVIIGAVIIILQGMRPKACTRQN